MIIKDFWKEYLDKAGLSADTDYIDCFYFGWTEESANKLLELVLIGKKQATTSCLTAYEIEGAPLPQVGSYSIVTDWNHNPRCIIQTTAVTIFPFKDMTFDICKREGEDECLETWRSAHIEFISQEGKELGFEFTENLLVVFEDFKIVYPAEL